MEIDKNQIKSVLEEVLVPKGYTVAMNARVKGESGIEHEFFAYAENKSISRRFGIDVDECLSTITILKFYIKILDIGKTIGYLVAPKHVDEMETKHASDLAQLYGIKWCETLQQLKREISQEA